MTARITARSIKDAMSTGTHLERDISLSRGASLVGLVFLGVGCSILAANPIYSVTPCGGPGQIVCSVTPAGHTPTPAETAALTPSLFDSFYADKFGVPVTAVTVSWFPRVANAHGYIIGDVAGDIACCSSPVSGPFNTEFVFHAGSLLCCFLDRPFSLLDINDQDLVVGVTTYPIYPAPLFASANSAETNIPLTFTNPIYNHILATGGFGVIDDSNRMIFVNPFVGQQYLLDPVATPEPESTILFVTALCGCALLCGRRMKLHQRDDGSGA